MEGLMILIVARNISIIVFLGCLINLLVRRYLNKRMDKMEREIPFEVRMNLKKEFIDNSIENGKKAFKIYCADLEREYRKYRKVRVG